MKRLSDGSSSVGIVVVVERGVADDDNVVGMVLTRRNGGKNRASIRGS